MSDVVTRTRERVRSLASRGAASPIAERWPQISARLPFATVIATVVFNLVVLRAEIHPAAFLNDSAQHIQMVRWAARQFAEGRIPFDGWYRFFALGSPNFHQYHTLPHIITAYFSRFFGVDTTFNMALYLLLSTWPIAIYWAARIWGWNRWTAACAAIVSPLIVSAPAYGFEHGSYIWRGYGVWPELWAMWLLPFAWALGYRAVKENKRYARAALVIALTVACHLILGYVALLAIGIWVLVERAGFVRRLGRGALLGFGAVFIASWTIVPLLSDRKYTTQSTFYVHNFFADSYGARKVLGWLFTGGLFDEGRLPIVTLLVFAGILTCIRRWRTDDRARALLGVWAFSMLLFFGRPTLGPLMSLLPGNKDLQVHRFIAGVHLGGIFLAGVGAVALGHLIKRVAQRFLRSPREAVAVCLVAAVGVAWISPAFVDRARYDRWGAQLINFQRGPDATDGADVASLIAIAKQRGNGRVYAGMRARDDYKVGQVPVYAELADNDADEVGFIFRTIASMSTDVEAYFNERNPAHYAIYDVSYVLLPRGQKPFVPATLLATKGRHALWLTTTNSYLDVVDTTAPITADRTNLATQVGGFLGSSLALRHLYPTIAFAGNPPAPPTTVPGYLPKGSPGRVVSEADNLDNGAISGEVVATRRSVVLLKSSYHPRWRVAVDSVPQPTEMIAPSFVGVTIPPGRHLVYFYYAPFGGYPKLFLLALLTLIGLAVVPRSFRRRTARRPPPPPTARSVDLTKVKLWLKDVRSSPNLVPTIIAAVVAFAVYELSVEKSHQFYNTYSWLADAFLHGHLDVAHPPPFIEFVTINGRHYSHQGPLPGILLMPFIAIWGIGFELRQFAVLEGTAIAAAVWSLATRLGLRGWRRIGAWAFPVLGTTVWYESKIGHTWSVAALCSVLFLFLALNEYFGPQRLWLVGLLVGLAGLARPAAFLAMPGFALAVREPKKVVSLAKGAIGPFAVMLGYNFVRFGTISDKALETYYESDYYRTLRPPGLFNARNLPWNLYSWFLLRPHLMPQFPWFKLQSWGNSLPFTSPAFFAAFWAKRERWLWVSAVVVLIPAGLFYANGYVQFGIRYLLDAVPFLSALIFICLRDRRARWYWPLLALSIAINAYGVAYTTVFPLRYGQ